MGGGFVPLPIFLLGKAMPRKIAWSLSKAQVALNCTLRYNWQYRQKRGGYRVTHGAGRIGSAVHVALELLLKDKATDIDDALRQGIMTSDLTTPEIHEALLYRGNILKFLDRFESWCTRHGVRQNDVLVEQRVGMTEDFSPVKFFDKEVWFRGVLDLWVNLTKGGGKRVVILDHKTGDRKEMDSYRDQFKCYAIAALAHEPDIEDVRCAIHFVRPGEIVFDEVEYTADDIKNTLRPWLKDFVAKAEDAAAGEVRANSDWWCNFCEYRPLCPAHTEGSA